MQPLRRHRAGAALDLRRASRPFATLALALALAPPATAQTPGPDEEAPPSVVPALGAADEEIDCSVPDTDRFVEYRCATVLRASELGGCIDDDTIDGHACIVMDADASFCDADVTTAITAVFDRPGVDLDCAGGAIDHGIDANGGGRPAPPREPVAAHPNGPAPAVWFPTDRSLSDIAIRNCTIRRTGERGIAMFRFFGGQLDANGRMADGGEPLGHHDILMQDLYLENLKTGIYLGNYSRDVTMERLVIDGTDRIALYTESGSHRVTLKDSVIANNLTREAVAIDSTYDSTLENNLFVDNREGAVNLYQNCGELKGIVCPVVRDTPPNGNRIAGNRFVDNGITELQVASRQGRKHSAGWCATLDGEPGRHRDTAEDNTVVDNVFVCDEGTALTVMDGPNLVAGNRIVARERCVPYEISTGGLGREASDELLGLEFEANAVDSVRPPRLRNVPEAVLPGAR